MAIITVITQVAHGLPDLAPVRFENGVGWVLAQADIIDNYAIGIVNNPTANEFDLVMQGDIVSALHGLSLGVPYYLSDGVAGDIVTVEPANSLQLLIPIDANNIEVQIKEPAMTGVTMGTLDDTDDTIGGGLQTGMVPRYNLGTFEYNIQYPFLGDSDDVDLVTTPPVIGDRLTFDGTEWKGQAPAQYANFFEMANASVTTINSAGVYEIVNGALIKEPLSDFTDLSVLNTTVTNDGLVTYKLKAEFDISLEPASGNNQNMMAELFHNGVAINGRTCMNSDNNKCQSGGMTTYVELAPADTLDVRVVNGTSATNIHVSDITLNLTEVL